jgi:hypothetical protein
MGLRDYLLGLLGKGDQDVTPARPQPVGRYVPVGQTAGQYLGANDFPQIDRYADEARADTCYPQPAKPHMYASPTPPAPVHQTVNECPTGNCFTDKLGSTLLSDIATLAPGVGMSSRLVRSGLVMPEQASAAYVSYAPRLNFAKDWATLPESGLDFADTGKNVVGWGTRAKGAVLANAKLDRAKAQQILETVPDRDLRHMRDYYLKFGAQLRDENRNAILATPTPYQRAIYLDNIRKKGGK